MKDAPYAVSDFEHKADWWSKSGFTFFRIGEAVQSMREDVEECTGLCEQV